MQVYRNVRRIDYWLDFPPTAIDHEPLPRLAPHVPRLVPEGLDDFRRLFDEDVKHCASALAGTLESLGAITPTAIPDLRHRS